MLVMDIRVCDGKLGQRIIHARSVRQIYGRLEELAMSGRDLRRRDWGVSRAGIRTCRVRVVVYEFRKAGFGSLTPNDSG